MGAVIVVSGPSGSGKTSLARKAASDIKDSYFSVSTTTRDIRVGEKDGYDYNFVSKDEFLSQIEQGLFLEWAEVHSNYYGTSLKPVNEALDQGKVVIFDIDVQGHRLLREKFGNLITSVFVTTKDVQILRTRLENRQTDTKEQIDKRVQNAFEEMQYIKEYDFMLINDDFNETLNVLKAMIDTAKFKSTAVDLEDFNKKWQNLAI